MSDKTAIQWTDSTWNPLRARNRETGKIGWFCEHASKGCDRCYAEKMNVNTYFGNGLPYKASSLPQLELFLDEKMLRKPLGWREPRKVFVCSMTDLFGRFVPDEYIDRVFAVMALAKRHTFQILTKRADRMREYMERNSTGGRIFHLASQMGYPQSGRWPLPNVWLGVSAENQKTFEDRWGHLRETPAAVRFISMEPLIAPIDMHSELWEDLGEFIWPNWVIVGGESGPGARPFNVEWARSIIEQCQSAGVSCFLKQLGANVWDGARGLSHKLRDRKGGDMSEWPADIRVRQFPSVTA